jgi:hypothetical protein
MGFSGEERLRAVVEVPADPLARRKIGAFLRLGISTSCNGRGVGEGHKAAAEARVVGRLLVSLRLEYSEDSYGK